MTDELIQKHLDGLTTEAEAEALSAQIVADEEIRARYLKAAQVHGALADESLTLELEEAPSAAAGPSVRFLAWPQQIAAALIAGALVGLLGVGVVWAVGSPKSQARVLHVANGDFEACSGPIANGIPFQFGQWGGNPAEVIEEADGNRILRMLKTGAVKGGPEDFASNCSVFQLVDLSSLRQQWEITDSESQVTLNLSARFRRDAAPTDAELPKLEGSCRIFLFNMEPEAIGEGWPGVIREDGVGSGKKSIKLDPGDEPTTITASCLLESDATVALIVVSAGRRPHAAPIELGGYFVDDVQLTAIKQPNLPVRFVK